MTALYPPATAEVWHHCPRCLEQKYLSLANGKSTRVCFQCRLEYHVCPQHGRSVWGAGITLNNTSCQCPTLQTQWGQAFQSN